MAAFVDPGAHVRVGLAGPRLAIVVVFDEGETTEQVPFVVLAPGLSHVTDRRPLNHYALTRLIDEIVGVPLLRDAAHAPRIAPTFRLGG